MSYQVLARKWRPKNFHEMVGQEHVLRALINALDNQRLHHAYLFTGTRGVGKTTIARIFAKSLNCETGVSAEPCGVCRACTEIDEGRFVDLIEVDAASRTKVEDTRELLENVQYAPTQGRYKVYLIDEVHMLSGHSFNALLKTLEEPPPHVKFLLATTDPQKLPITILSRCLQFSLKRLSRERISSHLEMILNAEGLNFEPAALGLVARAADGSMRDALSLLDQAIAYGSGQVIETEVSTMLGTIDRGQVFDLVQALVAGDGQALLQAVDHLAQQAPDFSAVLAELISVLHHCAVAQSVPGALGDEVDQSAQIEQLAGQMSPEDIQLYYQIALLGRKDLPLAPDARSGFEMIMLRMLAFRPDSADSHNPAGGSGGGREALRAAVGKGAQAPAATQTAPATASVAEVVQSPVAPPVATTPATTPSPAAATVAAMAPEPQLDSSELAPASEADTDTPLFGEQQREIPTEPQAWAALIERLPLTAMTRQLALNCVVSNVEGGVVQLALNESHQHVMGDRHLEKLAEVLSSYCGKPMRVNITLVAELAATPVQLENERQAQRQSVAESAIHNDPNVRALVETFDAQIQNGSIRPHD